MSALYHFTLIRSVYILGILFHSTQNLFTIRTYIGYVLSQHLSASDRNCDWYVDRISVGQGTSLILCHSGLHGIRPRISYVRRRSRDVPGITLPAWTEHATSKFLIHLGHLPDLRPPNLYLE